MSAELMTPAQQALAAQAKFDAGFDDLATSSKFLPRLQLFTSNSEAVQMGQIPLAHYGLVKGKNSITDLGKTVLVMPLAWRPKAIDSKANPVVAYHKADDERFKEIVKRANANPNSGCLYGPEFLVWLPEKGFVTFLMGSKSARNEAAAVRACMNKAMVLSANLIQTKDYRWHAPKAEMALQGIEAPPEDRKDEAILEFLNPEDVIAEEAKQDGTQDVTR